MQSFSFDVGRKITDPVLFRSAILSNYEHISYSYNLRGGEDILNPWKIKLFDRVIELGIPSPNNFDPIDIIPSLLIYLAVFEKMKDIALIDRQISYYYVNVGVIILTIPEGFTTSVISTTILPTTDISRIEFNTSDLEYREFVVTRSLKSDKFLEWLALKRENIAPLMESRYTQIPIPNI